MLYFTAESAKTTEKNKQLNSAKQQKFIFEIKPGAKLEHPGKLKLRPTERERKTYTRKAKEYARSMDKKEAAEKWCAERGYRFEFMTEKFLYKK